MRRVSDKIALITGAGSGIGRATSLLYAREGASVILVGRRRMPLEDVAQEVISSGGRALPLEGDITDEACVRSVVEASLVEFGGIDILINNAGKAQPGRPLHEFTDAMWKEALDVNLTGTFRFIRGVLPHFLKRNRGTIVNVSSASALVGMPNMAGYSAAKSGVVALTRSVAVEYGHLGIRCNCVCPGAVTTPMTEAFLADATRRRRVIAGNLLPRLAEPGDIANTILYLGSDESSFLTGAILAADGGLTAH